MTTVLMLYKSGGDYDEGYVSRLARSFREHVRCPMHLACLTDEAAPFALRHRELDEVVPLRRGWPGWWSKLELFGVRGPVVYIDLDTAIVGDVTDLVRLAPTLGERVVMLRGFYRGDRCSGVMAWAGDLSWLVDAFKDEIKAGARFNGKVLRTATRTFAGDQAWIDQALSARAVPVVFAQDVFSGIASYKVDIRPNGGKPRAGDRIVCFHGKPRPHELQPTPQWIGGAA